MRSPGMATNPSAMEPRIGLNGGFHANVIDDVPGPREKGLPNDPKQGLGVKLLGPQNAPVANGVCGSSSRGSIWDTPVIPGDSVTSYVKIAACARSTGEAVMIAVKSQRLVRSLLQILVIPRPLARSANYRCCTFLPANQVCLSPRVGGGVRLVVALGLLLAQTSG